MASATRAAKSVLDVAFEGQSRLFASISEWTGPGEGVPDTLLRDLAHFSIDPVDCRLISLADDADEHRAVAVFAVTEPTLSSLLAAAIGADLGASNSVADLRIMSPDLGLVALVYGDRGMDVGGINRSHLARLARAQQHRLLAHNLSEMKHRYPEIDGC